MAARRRAIQLLGDKQAVRILFEDIAPRFADRPGGYTRILKLAAPRLGDAGACAILELVGVRDRVSEVSQRPAFDDDATEGDDAAQSTVSTASKSAPAEDAPGDADES